MKKIIMIFFTLSLSIFIFLNVIELVSFNEKNYIRSYDTNNLEVTTNKSREEFIHITKDLINYMKGRSSNKTLLRNFNKKEVLHMEDVMRIYKGINNLKKILGLLLVLISILYYRKKKINELMRFTLKGLSFNYLLVFILVIMIYLDFSKYFYYFHLIFFNNDLWLLDPNKDLLIQMMPEKFFVYMAKKIIIYYYLSLSLIQGITYIVNKFKKME